MHSAILDIVDDFWNWFKENNQKYLHINEIEDIHLKESLVNELIGQLHKYNKGLYFEISGKPKKKNQLVITAGGNVCLFENIELLVNKAPKLNNWDIIAFKPPLESDFEINYGGIKLRPKDMWFLPLEDTKNLKIIGIRVFIKNFNHFKKKKYLAATYFIIDTLLGEKSSALDLDYVEIKNLSYRKETDKLMKMTDLKEYIDWEKSNQYTMNN